MKLTHKLTHIKLQSCRCYDDDEIYLVYFITKLVSSILKIEFCAHICEWFTVSILIFHLYELFSSDTNQSGIFHDKNIEDTPYHIRNCRTKHCKCKQMLNSFCQNRLNFNLPLHVISPWRLRKFQNYLLHSREKKNRKKRECR